MSKFIIEDWAGNHVFRDKVFEDFEDARAFISEYADEQSKIESDQAGDYSEEYIEGVYNGYCEDLYAIEVKD